ncbi:MAG: hypothetical protein WCJ18_00255 [Planctomycetota bacterium]
MDYVIDRLGNTTFALRPDYDSVVAQLGYEPPLGVPQECTFEWAWAAATHVVAKQNRLAAMKAAKEADSPPVQKAAPRKTVRVTATGQKAVARKRTPRKPTEGTQA